MSSEWFNRPDDERYLSLDDLWANVKGRSERSRSRVVQTADIRVEAARDNPERLHLMLPKAHEPVAPTHWAFGQLASIVGAPASYLRQLPAPLAGINLQYGLTNHRAEQVKTFETEDGRTELRAVTGPDYGRIHDHELVEAVQRIAGNGTGDTRWKVPGVLDWSTGVYNPDVEISRDTTTLYASDRDVFLFLVDDHNPIEAGRLPDGSPDLYFRASIAGTPRLARRPSAWRASTCGRCARTATSGASRISRRSPFATRSMPPRASRMKRPRADTVCQFLAAGLREWYQGGAAADRRADG